MKLFEFEAKKIFSENGIAVPRGVVVETPAEGLDFFNLHKPVVLKAQVLSGGRGKAGGIKFAGTKDDFENNLKTLRNLKIKNLPVKKVLVEEKLDIKNEFYLGYSILRSEAKIVLLLSKEGGVEIEELAREKPSSVLKHQVDILDGLKKEEMDGLAGQAGFPESIKEKIVETALLLYGVFTKYECAVAEINPLVVTGDGRVIAADARVSIYDEAIPKHPEYSREEDAYTELEKKARKQNLGYVEMDGNIGVIGNGAGLNMATLDIISYFGGKPANFLEVSGRTYHKAKEALEIILSNPNVRIIFGNFFGCISRCDVIARGIAEAAGAGLIKVPIVISMRGTGAKEGIQTLKNAGLKEIYEDDVDAGAHVVRMLKKITG